MAQAESHFWDPCTAAYALIANIAHAGPDSNREDVVRHAWNAILRLYFPSRAASGQQHCYAVDTEPYYRPPRPHAPDPTREYTMFVRMMHIELNPTLRTRPSAAERDILWVRCKPPSHDTPEGWTELIDETAEALELAHPDRMLFLIVAIGLKWMVLEWAPGANASLKVLADNRTDACAVRPGLCYKPDIEGQSHVIRSGEGPDIVDTMLAYSLDFWTTDQQTGQVQNLPALQLLEDCFAHIGGASYEGENPKS